VKYALVIWYFPGDLLAKASVRDRRAVGTWIAAISTGLWLAMPSAIWLIGFMSVVALWSVPASETPVEIEDDEGGESINN
jgi:hypothetical protein